MFLAQEYNKRMNLVFEKLAAKIGIEAPKAHAENGQRISITLNKDIQQLLEMIDKWQVT